VDDTKISHADPEVVTMIIDQLESTFGKMTMTRGSSHIFLGMYIEFNKTERTAKIIMGDYLKEAIIESGLNIEKAASTPANKNLFEIDEKSTPLSGADKDTLHSVVENYYTYPYAEEWTCSWSPVSSPQEWVN
jgi:hypothetical protein